MTYRCPACQRSFGEAGFCPYDGKPLAALAIAQTPTVLSEILPAQSAPEAEHDRSGVGVRADARLLAAEGPLAGPITVTDPNTLTEPSTAQPARTEPAPPTNKIRALSAAQTPTQVGETLRREPVASEYDRLVGETLDGRYYVQRKIGEGGMGVVFAAKHAVIERPLAIKVLKREVMRDTATIKRFVQEAKAASRIGHPNIVDVTDFGTTPDGMTYSVMEYVDGKTLSVAIKEGAPFPPEKTIRIATQIARALGAAHDKGIVHRDLKPENVFLIDRDDRPDFVKIVDFGIAKVQPLDGAAANEPRLTRAGSVFGTPEYMAPEQAAGRSDTDHRVDIYALGTIMYEMTVGRTPHRSNSTVRTIAMQMLDPITPPSQVHPDLAIPKLLELAIMKALAKKREERFQTMAELVAALDEVTQFLKRDSAHTVSLPPLPPGADPKTTPSLPPAQLRSSDVTTAAGTPRRSKPSTRPLHEPVFTTKTSTILPVYDAPEEAPPRRWPYALLAVVLLVGGGLALVIAMRPGGDHVAAGARDDAATQRGDAQLITEAPDAGLAPADAVVVVALEPDAGVHAPRRDAGVAVHPLDPHGKVTVEVLTRPGEADVFVGHTFRGPSGVRLQERYGTRLDIECRAPHFKGKLTIVFDGTRDSVMCTATRIPFCVEGLKNPIDECEQDPSKPSVP